MGDTSVAEQLRELGIRGILVTAAQKGLIEELRCSMPDCHCPKGEGYFEPRPKKVSPWAPSVDHIDLKSQGGQLTLDNVRLAHVLCNRVDFAKNHDIAHEKDLATARAWQFDEAEAADLVTRLKQMAEVAKDRATSKEGTADQEFERGRVDAYAEMLGLLEAASSTD